MKAENVPGPSPLGDTKAEMEVDDEDEDDGFVILMPFCIAVYLFSDPSYIYMSTTQYVVDSMSSVVLSLFFFKFFHHRYSGLSQ